MDKVISITALDQRASGSITYGVPVAGVKATGNVTVVDYLKAILTAASGTITYGSPVAGVRATGTITYGAPDDGDTVIVNGNTFTKVAAAPGAGEFTSIVELEALCEAVAAIHSSQDGTDVTIEADAHGTAGNAITLALGGGNTGTMSISGATLLGGVNGDTVTVDGTLMTCVDASPGANQFSNITELTALIEALANVGASDNGTVVTVTASTAGAAGNSIAMSKTGSALTLSGATLAGGYDNLTINFNGTALVQGTNFTAETSNSVTATNIAAAIDAIAGVACAAVGNVATITNDDEGTAGNSKTITTSSTAAATVSGATLSGGVNGDTVIVDGNTFTCVTSSPGAGEFTTIAQLEALVEAVTGVDSTQDGTTITITATAPGTGGNAITLALGGSNAGTMAISGATLTGGVAQTYTEAMQVIGADRVEAFCTMTTMNGTSPTVDITPQVSADKSNWLDAVKDDGSAVTFAQFTATGSKQVLLPRPGQWVRFKIVLGGTNPVVTGELRAVCAGRQPLP